MRTWFADLSLPLPGRRPWNHCELRRAGYGRGCVSSSNMVSLLYEQARKTWLLSTGKYCAKEYVPRRASILVQRMRLLQAYRPRAPRILNHVTPVGLADSSPWPILPRYARTSLPLQPHLLTKRSLPLAVYYQSPNLRLQLLAAPKPSSKLQRYPHACP